MTQGESQPFPGQRTDEMEQKNTQRLIFRDGNHALHVQALYAWLHPVLHELPGIDWTKMPSRVIGALINGVGNSPHAPHIALATASALGAIGASSLHTYALDLKNLLSSLHTYCESWDGAHFTKDVWEEYISKTEKTSRRRSLLVAYSAATECHLPGYLEELDPDIRTRLAPYVLPRLPARFLEKYGGSREIFAQQRQRRKEKSDVLAPLHTLLVALIQFRKQAAQRLLHVFREACARAASGEALPLQFTYEDVLPEVNRDARTVAEVHLEKRTIVLAFNLWNRQTWVEHHTDQADGMGNETKKRRWRGQVDEQAYFVECLNDASQLLWFGDLIQQGVLSSLDGPYWHARQGTLSEQDRQRLVYAQAVGASKGFALERPGIFTPARDFGRWLGRMPFHSQALVFDPESLYRGCLFGAALATLALTNGSRVTELLQVSADRFKGHLYEEKINGQPTGKQRVIWLQHLLPKGRKTESERQLFPISPHAYELLREIGALLKETHGCIPMIRPHPENTKQEDLGPERYLFQWQASSDGQVGGFAPSDVSKLIRFILHGLEFRTKQGEPFVASAHLLRHVMATAARHEHEVPAEVLAFVLHHQQRGLAIPVSTEYYSQMTQEQQLVALAEFLIDVEEQAAHLLLTLPDERSLAHMDEDLREVFERWHVLLETAFGFCGRVGLCPRGYQRNLCIGCPHLVPNPAKRESAVKWRETYAKQVKQLESEGAEVDARQTRLQVRELDDLIADMDVMQQAMENGTHQPVFLQLPAASYDEGSMDVEAEACFPIRYRFLHGTAARWPA